MTSSLIEKPGALVDYDHDPEDPTDQCELFLIKNPDVSRDQIKGLLEDFVRFCKPDNTTTLEQARFLMMLESRGETKTASEYWKMMMEQKPSRHGRRVAFLQWATAHFNKSWEELHTFFDEELFKQTQALIAQSRVRREEAEKAIQEKKEREDAENARRTEEMERESKLTGVAAKAAFFRRLSDKGSGKTNEEKIREDADIRKKMREAKQLEQQAAEEAKRAQEGAQVREKAEAAAREAKLKAEEEAALEEQRKKREEKERRASFKAAAEAKWLKSPSASAASTPVKPTPGKLRSLVKESPHGTNPQSPN